MNSGGGFESSKEYPNLYHDFVKYVSLNVLSMLGVSAYVLFDTYFIATKIGLNALAGLNIALPFFFLVSATGIMLGIGTSVRYSILCGEKKEKSAIQIILIGLITSLILGLIIGVVGYLNSKDLMRLMGADDVLLPYSHTYISTIFLFSLTIILNGFGICVFRAAGHPKFAMTAALINSISNLVLDYIFVYKAQYGIWGAAVASGIAPGLALAYQIWIYCFHLGRFEFEIPKLELSKIVDILRLGFPSFFTEFSTGFIMIFFNMVILKCSGNIGISAYGIIANVAIVVTAIFTGVAQGIQPLISYYYGERKQMLVEQISTWAYNLTKGISIGLYICFFAFCAQIINIFNFENNAELIEIADKGIKVFFTAMIFWGGNIVNTHILASCDNPDKSFWLSACRGGIITIPVLLLLARYWSLTGVWITMPVAEMLTYFIFI